MRGESGPLTSMGTFIRTQFSFQGFLNELKPPFCAPIEYQKGASYICVTSTHFNTDLHIVVIES